MKIPFMKYHIVHEQVLTDKETAEKESGAMSFLLAGCIPSIEQVNIALHKAKVGHDKIRNVASAARLALKKELGIPETPTIIQLYKHLLQRKKKRA